MNCLLCGSPGCRTGPSLVCCVQCGSAFSTQRQPISYYEDQYSITLRSVDDTEHRRLFRIPEQVRLLRQMQKECPPPRTLLDIGCDKGYFLDQARRHGYEVTGVEPSRAARSYCERVGLNVLPDLSSLNGVFDIITMWHSLEHFPDPNEAIDMAYRLMDRNGQLWIRVPDYSCIWRKLTGRHWVWYQPQNHHVHFAAAGLKSLLTRHGFRLVALRSQRPNNFITNRSFSLASACYGRRPLKKTLGRFYEQLTGVELFCIAAR
jgi:SAM-dependent methyltransferase